MQKITFFTDRTDITIEKMSIYYEEFPDIKFYYLLTEDCAIPIRHNCAYIGDSTQISNLLEDFHADFPVLFITTDCPEGFLERFCHLKCNLLYINASISTIYRALNESFGIYSYWADQFQVAALSQESTLHTLLELGSKMLHSPLFLLNTGYTMVDCSLAEKPDITFPGYEELDQKGFLSPAALKKLQACPYMELYPIRQGTTAYAFLLLYLDEENTYRRNWFLPLLTEPLKQFLLNPAKTIDSSLVMLTQLLTDLINMQIVTPEEVLNRASFLNLPPDAFYHVAVILFPEGHTKDEHSLAMLNRALGQVLPSARVCIYQGHPILLFISKNRELPNMDKTSLASVLEQHDAYFGYGGGFSHLEQLRSFYLWACAAVHLGQKLGTPGERVFYFDDYRIYYMISLCCTGFQNTHFHNNLLYLCHPDIITLYRYDQAHHSDYMNILYQYLSQDCNFAETARRLNYHRNTLMYKISKIEAITGHPLSGSEYKQSLLLSCKVAWYIRDYLGRDVQEYNGQDMAGNWSCT